MGERDLRAQLVGLGAPGDFTAPLFGPARVWESASPFVGPAHVGRCGRSRYVRKSLRRELRRLTADGRLDAGDVPAVAERPVGSPVRVGGPRAVEFRRSRTKAGDDGSARPFGLYTLTFPRAVRGPVCVGYASHFGLGLFVPAGADRGRRD